MLRFAYLTLWATEKRKVSSILSHLDLGKLLELPLFPGKGKVVSLRAWAQFFRSYHDKFNFFKLFYLLFEHTSLTCQLCSTGLRISLLCLLVHLFDSQQEGSESAKTILHMEVEKCAFPVFKCASCTYPIHSFRCLISQPYCWAVFRLHCNLGEPLATKFQIGIQTWVYLDFELECQCLCDQKTSNSIWWGSNPISVFS